MLGNGTGLVGLYGANKMPLQPLQLRQLALLGQRLLQIAFAKLALPMAPGLGYSLGRVGFAYRHQLNLARVAPRQAGGAVYAGGDFSQVLVYLLHSRAVCACPDNLKCALPVGLNRRGSVRE